MKAVTVVPGTAGLQLTDVDPPTISSPTEVLVEILRVGICPTDRAIARGEEGVAPLGASYLIPGHEMLGRVSSIGKKVSSLHPGDLVVATIRRGCGQCVSCRNGRGDYCYTGHFLERGITQLNGFMTQWIVEEEINLIPVPQHLEGVGVLVEILATVEKAVDTAATFQRRLLPPCGHPEHGYDAPNWGVHKRALVAGAGPMGILGAFILRARGADTYVIATQPSNSVKGRLVEEIGAHYISTTTNSFDDLQTRVGTVDMVLEATGSPTAPLSLVPLLGANGAMALVGIPSGTGRMVVDTAALVREMVLYNRALLGSVNAGPSDFRTAVEDLALFKQLFGDAINRVITHTYPLEQFEEPLLRPAPGGIKSVLTMVTQSAPH